MNSTLATESTVTPEEKPPVASTLESWTANERMRHVPEVEWMIRKVDTELRKRFEKLTSGTTELPAADPRHGAIEAELRSLCRAIERLIDSIKTSRHNGGNDLPSRVNNLLTQAAASLRSLESTPFGRRHPFHLFDRSKAEPVYAALLTVMGHVDRLVPLVRAVDPNVDERLLEGLVVLQNPIDDRMLRPIA